MPSHRLRAVTVRTAVVSLVSAAGLALGGVAGAASAAAADAAPPVAPAQPQTVGADALPTWQLNGVVWSQVIVGTTVYVTGNFTAARPPGVAAGGAGEIPVAHLFAYDLTTGNPVASFNHTLDAQGLVIKASPDGSRVYVGGDFTMVDGITRGHIAAFNTADNTLVTDWAPNIGGQVRALAFAPGANGTVYVGGNFPSANGQTRGSLAAFAATGKGAIQPWAPVVAGTGGYVWSMVMSPTNDRVIVGGSFATINGVDAYGMGSVGLDGTTVLPWAVNQRARTAGLNGAITTLETDGTSVFGAGYSYTDPVGAKFEGQFSAQPLTGEINWINDCEGDQYDLAFMSGVLYAVGHAHDCAAINEFADTKPRARWQKALAINAEGPAGIIKNFNNYGWDYRGLPYAEHLQWYPDLEFGTFTPDRQAAWSVEAANGYVVLGGEFPKVNGVAQQGLTRFAVPGVNGPRTSKPIVTGSTPVAAANPDGTVTVQWNASWDRDDETLTYDLYRKVGGVANKIATATAQSAWFTIPTLKQVDSAAPAGASVSYQVLVKDSDGNAVWGPLSSPLTVAAPSWSAYGAAVRADKPAHLWSLSDAASTFTDEVGTRPMTGSGQTASTTGPLTGVGSTTLTATSMAWTTTPEPHSTAVTLEGWVNTTSLKGGRVLGFGNMVGTSNSDNQYNDLVLYVLANGKVALGLNEGNRSGAGSFRQVVTARAVNDGQWHHLAATVGPQGTQIFIDGRLAAADQTAPVMGAFPGYWRLGADNLNGLPNKPGAAALAGQIAQVAVYPSVLTQDRVRAHFLASGRAATWTAPTPADSYGQQVLAGAPTLYWRMNETSGTLANDSTGNGVNGTFAGTYTLNQAGAVPGDTAAKLNGATGYVVAKEQWLAPRTWSTELWFSSTSVKGGRLSELGSAASGTSTATDRQVTLLANGKLQAGVNSGGQVTITSPKSYNDGAWHHVVLTQGPNGLDLWVDAELVASNPVTTATDVLGYWRTGGDATWGGTTSNFVAGTVDEFAVYPTALDGSTVRAHYTASGRTAPNLTPTASFTATQDLEKLTVDAAASSDPDGTLIGYTWDFGDGSTGTGAQAAHTYAASGSYPVTLTVTDNRGGTATTTQTLNVTVNQAPTAAFTLTQDLEILTVDGSGSSDPEGPVAAYSWDFGDGGTGTGATATHHYTTPGTYPVTLTVTDARGVTASTTQSIDVVVNHAPVAEYTASLTHETLAVDATASSDLEGPIAGYAWDFGDGATGTGATASHTYTVAGSYPVVLTVTDGRGVTATTTQTFEVTVNRPPTAAFTHTEDLLALSVDASTSSDPDGPIASYAWDFGDGSTGTGATASHSYGAAGSYTVTLTVTDDRGVTATSTDSVHVVAAPNQAPTAAFTATPTWLAVAVDGSGSSDPEGAVAAYAWDFGDGSTGTGATASHTYAAAGSYTVTLTVTDLLGATGTTTRTLTVAPNPALAQDAFARTLTSGWGTADLGGAWTVTGTASKWTVANGVGNWTTATAGTGATASLNQLPARTDLETQVTVSTDKAATGGGQYISVIGRRIDAANDYRAKLVIASTGAVTGSLARTVAGVETSISSGTISGLTYAAGDRLVVRVQVQSTGTGGSTLRLKVWKEGTTEPSTWARTATDTTAALQGTGTAGLYFYVTGSSTNLPITFRADDLWVGPLR